MFSCNIEKRYNDDIYHNSKDKETELKQENQQLKSENDRLKSRVTYHYKYYDPCHCDYYYGYGEGYYGWHRYHTYTHR